MNVDLSRDLVEATAKRHAAPISAIEEILSGGTRVVFMNFGDADRMRAILKKRLIAGNVIRTRWVRNG